MLYFCMLKFNYIVTNQAISCTTRSQLWLISNGLTLFSLYCIERHCIGFLLKPSLSGYRSCLRKYCSSLILTYKHKKRAFKPKRTSCGGDAKKITSQGWANVEPTAAAEDKSWNSLFDSISDEDDDKMQNTAAVSSVNKSDDSDNSEGTCTCSLKINTFCFKNART